MIISIKKRFAAIIAGSAIYTVGILYKPDDTRITLAVFIIALAVIGGNIIITAIRNIIRGNVFDENLLMSIAAIGAFALGDYPEGTAVMLFYQVGELFQSLAVEKSKKSIASLMDIRPDFANVRRENELVKTNPDEVSIGDIILIKAGERIPLDAEIIEGSSSVDTSALTGESLPREAGPGDIILGGSVNLGGMLAARVTKKFGDSTVSKVLDLVENAAQRKSSSENFITKFARYYTPAVVVAAALLAAIPPLVLNEPFSVWVYRALTFLVISCPCALVISIPLSFFGGIGGASRKGILVKGGNYLEALARAETAVFDKTGTLTKGVFKVQTIIPCGITKEELLETATCAESYSNHPISVSLRQEYTKTGNIDISRVKDVTEHPGGGVTAEVDGRAVAVGNVKLLSKLGIHCSDTSGISGTIVHTAIDGVYRGYILIADEIREDASKAIKELREAGVKRTVMLTGDSKLTAEIVASKLAIDEVYAELLPDGKVLKVEELLKKQSSKGRLVFIGDGINDAPVLSRSDIGVAMGGLGSDAAIEAADIVIMTDEPSKLADAIRISRKTLSIAKQNIIFALGVKGAILLLGALGLASMWAAVFADVGVAVLAILNALRTLRTKINP